VSKDDEVAELSGKKRRKLCRKEIGLIAWDCRDWLTKVGSVMLLILILMLRLNLLSISMPIYLRTWLQTLRVTRRTTVC
jgi:hypothetical protein